MYFWESVLAKSVFGHFFCPFLIFPKNFPGKKLKILNNKSLKVLKAEGYRWLKPILFFNNDIP
jgi:hypothetical protein